MGKEQSINSSPMEGKRPSREDGGTNGKTERQDFYVISLF